MSVEWLFTAIVVTCLTIITIVVVIGGIVCIKDDTYSFAEYLSDLAALWKILAGALLGTVGRALTPMFVKLGKENGR